MEIITRICSDNRRTGRGQEVQLLVVFPFQNYNYRTHGFKRVGSKECYIFINTSVNLLWRSTRILLARGNIYLARRYRYGVPFAHARLVFQRAHENVSILSSAHAITHVQASLGQGTHRKYHHSRSRIV